MTKLRQTVLDGQDVEETRLSAWSLPDLCDEATRALEYRLSGGAHVQVNAPARSVAAESSTVGMQVAIIPGRFSPPPSDQASMP